MPDIHWGYGFPIGGVAAVDAREGVISPGGVGYDINCGVRLARTHLHFNFVEPRIDRLADALFTKIPAGVGSWGAIPGLSIEQLKEVVSEGAKWALRNGYATERDLEHTEEGGMLAGADPDRISERAYKRGCETTGYARFGQSLSRSQPRSTRSMTRSLPMRWDSNSVRSRF